MQMLLREKTRRIISTRDMLNQNSHNLLIIFSEADGGWSTVANFTLVIISRLCSKRNPIFSLIYIYSYWRINGIN